MTYLMPKTGVKIERTTKTTVNNPQFSQKTTSTVFTDLVGLEELTNQQINDFNTNNGTQAKKVIHAILPFTADVKEADLISYNPTRLGLGTAFNSDLSIQTAQLLPPLRAMGITLKHIEIYAITS